MKKMTLLFIGMMSFAAVKAQQKEGTVIYEKKTDLYRKIDNEQLRAMMPQYRTAKYMLLFSNSISVYKAVPEDEAPDPFENNGGGTKVMFKMMGSGDAGVLYNDFTRLKSLEQTELGAKTYIIEDSLKNLNWKLTNETKNILGHSCRKATATRTVMGSGAMRININNNEKSTDSISQQMKIQKIEIVAWYAEDIISPVGPESNGGLPGLILELNSNKGENIYTALEIKSTCDKKDLKEPLKGKRVTRPEYMKVVKEMMNNMNQGGARTFHFGD